MRAGPQQAGDILAAVREQSARGRHLVAFLVAFFGSMYYAAARPAEVIGLRLSDCGLPRRGWGVLRLDETRPRSGSAWTDSGGAHERRGLKHRPRKAVRPVPIPPELVARCAGTSPPTALRRTDESSARRAAGWSRTPDTAYGEVWAEARRRALTAAQLGSVLAKRPYDLRHAAVSTRLSSDVEPQLGPNGPGIVSLCSSACTRSSSRTVTTRPTRRSRRASMAPGLLRRSPAEAGPRLVHTHRETVVHSETV